MEDFAQLDMLDRDTKYNSSMERVVAIIALPLKGRKKNLSRALWIDYFAGERLGLNQRTVAEVLDELSSAIISSRALLNVCFLSDAQKHLYQDLLDRRCQSLGF